MTLILLISLMTLGGLLLFLAYIDYKTFRLPNRFTFSLIISGIAQAYLLKLHWPDHIIGAGIGYLAFVAIEQIFLKLRGYPGLGRGDAKLLAGGGAWAGWMGLPYIILMASLAALSLIFAGLLTGRLNAKTIHKQAWPFGPFLCAAIFVVWCALILRSQI